MGGAGSYSLSGVCGPVQGNVLITDGQDIRVRRLVDAHRKLALAQLVFERELGLTPLALAQLRAADKGNSCGPDVFFMMAADRQLEQDQEGAEPEPGVESDD
jgi:hypothetical protein